MSGNNTYARGGNTAPQAIQQQAEDALKKIEKTRAEMQTLFHAYYSGILHFPFLFDQLIYRNTINILDGPGSAGKSTLALQLALATIFQQPFLLPCFSHRREEIGVDISNVIYVTNENENPKEIMVSRLASMAQAMNVDWEDINKHFSIFYTENCLTEKLFGTITPTAAYTTLQRAIQKYQPDLVILDNLSNLAGIEENSNAEVNTFYSYLLKLKTTILILHHHAKSDITNGAGETTPRGAIAIRENARCRLVLKKDVLAIEKANFSQYDQHYIPLARRDGAFFAAVPEPLTSDDLKEIDISDETKNNGNGNGNEKKTSKKKRKEDLYVGEFEVL